MQTPNENPFREGLKRYFTPKQLKLLSTTPVGIAGAGGLGSNLAMLLARSGVENFVIIDRDEIDNSNLNRQHYWPDQIGQAKVHALKKHLLALNDNIRLETRLMALNERNLPEMLVCSRLWAEALDDNIMKKQFVETALLHGCVVVAASGIAGYGGQPLQKKIIGNFTVIGDFQTGVEKKPPLAPKVMQAAAMMADRLLELILD